MNESNEERDVHDVDATANTLPGEQSATHEAELEDTDLLSEPIVIEDDATAAEGTDNADSTDVSNEILEERADDGTIYNSDDIPEAAETGQDVSDDDLIPNAPTPVVDEAAPEDDPEARLREERLTRLFESAVYGPGDERVGKVGQVYIDDQSQEPNWVTVKMGLFGTKEYFLPLDEAVLDGKRLIVPYSKETITSAPSTEIDQNLSPAEEDVLYNYYEVPGRMTNPAEVQGVVFPSESMNVDESHPEAQAADEEQQSSYDELFSPAEDAETGATEGDETAAEPVTAELLDPSDEAEGDTTPDEAETEKTADGLEESEAVEAPAAEAKTEVPSVHDPVDASGLFADDEDFEDEVNAAAELPEQEHAPDAEAEDAKKDADAKPANDSDVVDLNAFRRPSEA